jgi:hypothetical protein
VQWLDICELAELVMFAPGEEPVGGMQVGRPGVPVADGGGEEFQEASAMIAGTTMEAATAAEIRGALAAGTTVSWVVWSDMGLV